MAEQPRDAGAVQEGESAGEEAWALETGTDEEQRLSLTRGLKTVPPRAQGCPGWVVAALSASALLLGLLGGVLLGSRSSTAATPVPEAPPGRVHFLVVGDWGRDGQFNQSTVAESMGREAQARGSSFVVSTGDNFYDMGLADDSAAQFDTSFTRIYASPGLQHLNWYSVLGNHDYVSNAAAQTGPGLRKRDARWHCARNFQLKPHACVSAQSAQSGTECTPLLELFFIDTSPLVLKEWGPGGVRDGSRLNFSGLLPDHSSETQATLSALQEALAMSDARWKAVVGHHTLRSVGVHGDTPDLVERLLPILEAHHVDAYINGHDHCLQLIRRDDSPVYFMTSGAGSKAFRKQRAIAPEEGVLFNYNGQGFVSAAVAADTFEFTYKDRDGITLFSHVLTK